MKEKLSWGLGGFSEQVAVNGLNTLFMPVFNMGFGLDSKLIGWAMTIPRFFDMISDPIVGNMSDNCRSRFGRRRPFILGGGVLMALIFGLTYMASPYMGQWAMFGYATVACVLFYLAYTVYSVPYTALGLELTDDYDERAHIQKYRSIFNSCAAFTLPWIYKCCLLVGEYIRALHAQESVAWYQQPLLVFSDLTADLSIKAEVLGARYVAWGCAIFIICAIVPVSFFVKERVRTGINEKIGLIASVKLVSKNKPFALLLGMILMVIIGNFFVGPLLMYMNIFYVCGGDKVAGANLSGLNGSTTAVTMFLSAFLIPFLVQIFDKRKVLQLGLLVAASAMLLNFFLVNPNTPYLQLIPAGMLGFGLNCCWLLNGAFIADVCDQDELDYGYRREGMFAAAFGFIVKLAFTVIGVALGYLLSVAGYEAGAESMSPETILRLRYFLTFFPMACLLSAAVVFKFYPLTRQRIHEIQNKLEARAEGSDSI
ncbi:MFS transporter [Coraliomargarita sp. SDUM461004]|uniref:MFS transporter n=1 Tax=Thalassobacterium sedimentorum TaxID=3041258 RepID=A0ABU1AMD9_9BACT|nr:MFS transporter [Coraliomargarita sp. SDUM461004]MDQ8195972.1 MFS transporter [Coraliomargarita sp. SDUM461004]